MLMSVPTGIVEQDCVCVLVVVGVFVQHHPLCGRFTSLGACLNRSLAATQHQEQDSSTSHTITHINLSIQHKNDSDEFNFEGVYVKMTIEHV